MVAKSNEKYNTFLIFQLWTNVHCFSGVKADWKNEMQLIMFLDSGSACQLDITFRLSYIDSKHSFLYCRRLCSYV